MSGRVTCGVGDVGVARAARQDRGQGRVAAALGLALELQGELRLEAERSQSATWKRTEGWAVAPWAEVTVEAIAIGSQLVGLRVKSGAVEVDADVAQVERDAVEDRAAAGSETAVIWAVSGSIRRALRTTTVPRSKGPATAGVTTAKTAGRLCRGRRGRRWPDWV